MADAFNALSFLTTGSACLPTQHGRALHMMCSALHRAQRHSAPAVIPNPIPYTLLARRSAQQGGRARTVQRHALQLGGDWVVRRVLALRRQHEAHGLRAPPHLSRGPLGPARPQSSGLQCVQTDIMAQSQTGGISAARSLSRHGSCRTSQQPRALCH